MSLPLLSVQRALYSTQKRHIDELLEGVSRSFRAYEARYLKATASFRTVLPPGELSSRLARADIVYVGDYHTHAPAQATYLELAARALDTGGRVVLALELLEGRHQRAVDAFVAGRLSEAALLRQVGYPFGGARQIWPGFRELLRLARARRAEILAIDRRAHGPRSLAERDAYAAQRIARAAAAPDRPQVLVLMGQFHVAPPHLPRAVRKALGEVRRTHLTVYQNPEGVFFSLLRRGTVPSPGALVEVHAGALGLITASPVVCQRSFLDYVELEALHGRSITSSQEATLRVLVTATARLLHRPVPRLGAVALPEAGFAQLLDTHPGRSRPSSLTELAARVAGHLRLPAAARGLPLLLVDPVNAPSAGRSASSLLDGRRWKPRGETT